MREKKLLTRLTLLIFFIFIVNYLAMSLYWYTSIWWLDMPMHFLGGFWLCLGFIWLLPNKELSLKFILKIFLGVLLISIFWEVFEIIVNNYTLMNNFNIPDTLSDFCFDFAGGVTAIIYFFKRIMFQTENKV